uniref:Uncharacterized protein n=1 Tax=Timema monikensis TaxID=170555 RepID=A0A7R9EKG0_9NEOP|nr:unnamed protein product [Timema monikensis]
MKLGLPGLSPSHPPVLTKDLFDQSISDVHRSRLVLVKDSVLPAGVSQKIQGFLSELTRMFQRSRNQGSVTVSMKRCKFG